MELKETIKMMNSLDYKERFKAEYMQTKIRYENLHKLTIKYEAKTLNFQPRCSLELLKEQKKHMGNYLRCLEVRAEIEGISLDHIGEPTEGINDIDYTDLAKRYSLNTATSIATTSNDAYLSSANCGQNNINQTQEKE